MSSSLSLVMHFLCIVAIVTMGLAAICALMAKPLLRWSYRFEPGSRLALLRLYAAWPLLGGFAVGAMISLPSLNHVSKLPLDHCHGAGNCLGPPLSHAVTNGEIAIVVALLGLLAWAASKAFMQWRRACRLVAQIDRTAHAILAPGVRLVESVRPFAFSLGVFDAIAVLSTELVRALSPRQLAVVCAHEQVHLRHHDNWYKWVLHILCVVHFPRVKYALLREHAVVMELRADQKVARQIQDPVAVAETLVAVQRLMKPFDSSEPVCQFMGTALERRVNNLLDQLSTRRLPKYSATLLALTAMVIFVGGSTPLHDALELLIR